jgi:hypothetical protein
MPLGLTMTNIKRRDGVKIFSIWIAMIMIVIMKEVRKGNDIKKGTEMTPSIMQKNT